MNILKNAKLQLYKAFNIVARNKPALFVAIQSRVFFLFLCFDIYKNLKFSFFLEFLEKIQNTLIMVQLPTLLKSLVIFLFISHQFHTLHFVFSVTVIEIIYNIS